MRDGTGLRVPLVAPLITDHDRSAYAAGDETDVRQFEEEFANYVGCTHAVAVCSGTVALRLALRGQRAVSIPTYTCEAIRNACETATIVHTDSRFDVRSQTTLMSAPVTVLPHMFGTFTEAPAQAPIEDFTLSLGGVLGLNGQVGVCSTHWSKMISTGRGGLIFGNTLDLDWLHTEVERLGVGMSGPQAALGRTQLAQLWCFIERRRELAAFYTGRFRAAGISCPDADCGSVFFRYLVAVDDPADKLVRLAERGIEAGRGVFPPLHQAAGLPDEQFPGATWCVNQLLSVPVHPSVTDEQAEYVAEQVVETCGR